MGPLIDSGSALGGTGPTFVGTAWGFWPIVTVLVFARIYLRTKRGDKLDRRWLLDSALFLAIFAWVSNYSTPIQVEAIAHV